jgi:predicted dehydrogenase
LRGERGGVTFSLLDVSAPISLLNEGSEDWVDEAVDHQRATGGPDHILGVQHLVECVATGARPVASAEHAIHVLEVMDAARRSVDEARTVRIPKPDAGDWPFAARAAS